MGLWFGNWLHSSFNGLLNSKAFELKLPKIGVSGEDIEADHILVPFQKSMQGIPAPEKAG